MSSRFSWPLLAAVLALTSACATTPRTSTMSTTRAEAGNSMHTSPRHVISRGEILASGALSAEDVIRRLRPNLLAPRRTMSYSDGTRYTPEVYVDDTRIGGIEMLRSLTAAELRDVRYLTETEAKQRFMGFHPGGVILLRTQYR